LNENIALKAKLLDIYRLLRTRFGYRNWWPGNSPFEIVVGAVLTQNTNWANVEKAIQNLNAADVLEPARLLSLPVDELKRLVRPAGFYNQKAVRLRAVTRWWLDCGILIAPAKADVDALCSDLLKIDGIGFETADCILLYALRLPTFVIDAYTRRAAARIGITAGEMRYEPLKRLFERCLPCDIDLYNDFHAQWVALGKTYCRKKPLCSECPLGGICQFAKSKI